MIGTNLDFSGLAELSEDLATLSKAENRKVMRDATRAGATILKDEAVSRAPVKSGKLKKNIVVITQRERNGAIASGVHIRGTNPRTGASDKTMKASDPRNAFYWRFIEMGTSTMAPVPFVRPAYDAREEDAVNAAFAEANAAIDRVLSK